MRIFFVAVPSAGHALPLVPLAWAARLAGHDVLFATAGESVDLVVHAGLAAVEVARADVINNCGQQIQLTGISSLSCDDQNALAEPELRQLINAGGCGPLDVEGLRAALALCCLLGERTIDGIIRAAKDWRADAVVYDPYMVAGLVAAKAVGIPAFSHGIGVSHLPRTSARLLMIQSKQRYGLTDTIWEPTASINICPESMRSDSPDLGWPMRYTPYNGESILPAWLLEPLHSRPRICVTMGTAIPVLGHTELFDIVIDALSTCEVDVVILGAKDAIQKPLPDNIHAAGWLPLNAVLPTCSAIIHHGGAGTTFTTLAAGVPQLVIPQFADQPINAAAVASRGVGIYLPESKTDAASVRDLLFRLLDDPAISQAASEVRDEIAAMPPPGEIIERLATVASVHPARTTSRNAT
jgi:UDP:flavonoid glycosyltransferase YjiC (YdhE family)